MLARLFAVAPLAIIATAKFVPWMWEDVVASLGILSPETELPPEHVLQVLGGLEFFVVAIHTLGVAPRLSSLLGAAQYMTPIALMGNRLADPLALFHSLHPYYAFVLSFHIAVGFALYLDALALELKLLRRFAYMLPLLCIGAFKFVPAKLALVGEALASLAPGSELPPAELLSLIGCVEASLVVLVTLGVAPKVTHTFTALHIGVVPCFLLGTVASHYSLYYLFVLSLHCAVAVGILADAWAAPKELTTAQRRVAARNKRKTQ